MGDLPHVVTHVLVYERGNAQVFHDFTFRRYGPRVLVTEYAGRRVVGCINMRVHLARKKFQQCRAAQRPV